jgi:hypothetical protein
VGTAGPIESRQRTDADDPLIGEWLGEAKQLLTKGVPGIEVVRTHVCEASQHLAAGRTTAAWQSIRVAATLAGPDPTLHPYTIEAHAGIPEVCLALLEQGRPEGVDPAELRSVAATGLRRLRRYARAFPTGRPRALICLGWSHWLNGRHGAALRAWTRAAREGERLAMPWELARAHYELGRHLEADDRSPIGLDRDEHLDEARSILESLGCRTNLADIERTGSALRERGRP